MTSNANTSHLATHRLSPSSGSFQKPHPRNSHDTQAESSSQGGSRKSRDSVAPSTVNDSPVYGNGQGKSAHRQIRRSGGFLLDSVRHRHKNGTKDGPRDDKGKAPRVETPTRTRWSEHSSTRESPLSHEVDQDLASVGGVDGAALSSEDGSRSLPANGSEPSAGRKNTYLAPALDTTHLVNMALSLSEGRRRYASAGLATPPASMDNRRVRSAGFPPNSTNTMSPPRNSQMTPAMKTSPHVLLHSPPPAPKLGFFSSPASNAQSLDYGDADVETAEDWVESTFSAGTLSRADKARRFFELSNEHRRLLECLPPLKPDLTATGNYTFSSRSIPGSNQAVTTRVRSNTSYKHGIGREYNPLQLLRNRRIRNRERRLLEPPAEAFEDLAKVKDFVDHVKDLSEQPGYRLSTDRVKLPHYDHGEDYIPAASKTSMGHRRSDTASSRTQWTQSSWSFTPMELLADAIWTETDSNKAFLEDRRGNYLFPEVSRASLDSVRSVRRSQEQEPASFTRTSTMDSTFAKDYDDGPRQRGRKVLKFLSIHKVEDQARKRLHLNRARSEDSSSGSSKASDSRKKRPPVHDGDPFCTDIGPLERHMRQVMNQESSADTPEPISADKWDALPEPEANLGISTSSADAPGVNKTGRGETSKPLPLGLRRSRSYDDGLHARLYSQDLHGRNGDVSDETAPSSPAVQSFVPPIGMSLSPPSSRRQSPSGMARRFQKLTNRSGSKERNKIEQTDFAMNDSKAENGQALGNASVSLRRSHESDRPSFMARHATNDSITGSQRGPYGIDKVNTKDNGSAVSRLFKGGRLGEIVRGEGTRFGDRFRSKDDIDLASAQSEQSSQSSDVSDDDTWRSANPSLERIHTASGQLTRANSHAGSTRYHIPLPSFRTSNAADGRKSGTAIREPLSRQQSRSSRREHLVPPPIAVPSLSARSSTSFNSAGLVSMSAPAEEVDRRRSSAFTSQEEQSPHDTTSQGRNQPFATALSKIESQGGRHWSISDGNPQHVSQVTHREVLRVKALFLSSGVKARELYRRADTIREPRPSFLLNAEQVSGEQLGPVTRIKEISTAVQILSKAIEGTLGPLGDDVNKFRSGTALDLGARLDMLKQKAAEELTMKVHQTADEADAFTGEINTHQTLAVKQVNDALDDMFRHRRRRLRLVKRVGFSMLEWLVLAILWAVWFVVVILKLVKGTVVGFAGGVRWLLWF